MRHLVVPFALDALRRGAQIEQFLGPIPADVLAVRWAAARRSRSGEYEAWSYDVNDRRDSPEELLRIAESTVGARPERWVNHGIAGDEYADYVRSIG